MWETALQRGQLDHASANVMVRTTSAQSVWQFRHIGAHYHEDQVWLMVAHARQRRQHLSCSRCLLDLRRTYFVDYVNSNETTLQSVLPGREQLQFHSQSLEYHSNISDHEASFQMNTLTLTSTILHLPRLPPCNPPASACSTHHSVLRDPHRKPWHSR